MFKDPRDVVYNAVSGNYVVEGSHADLTCLNNVAKECTWEAEDRRFFTEVAEWDSNLEMVDEEAKMAAGIYHINSLRWMVYRTSKFPAELSVRPGLNARRIGSERARYVYSSII